MAFDSNVGFSGNNRTTPYLENLFNNWLKSDIDIILFGYPNVINDGYSSIKQIPVENGLLGIFSACAFLVLIVYKSSFLNISSYNLFFFIAIFYIKRPNLYINFFF